MKSVPLLPMGFLLVACASSPLAQFEERVRNDVARGYDFNQKNEEGQTLLHETAMQSHEFGVATGRVRILLEAGADPTLSDNEGNTPLHLLESSFYEGRLGGSRERETQQAMFAALLLEYGADPNARNHQSETPLHLIATKGVALLLLEAGADPNAQDNAGETPLHRWSWLGAEVTAALLAEGADPNVRNSAGETPLHEAAGWASYSRADTTRVAYPQARLLLLAGAEVNAADTLGRTALHRAVVYESPVHRVLLAGGADPNARDMNGRTPVHVYASGYDRPDVMPREFLDPLLTAGADVNAPDRLGRSPLHLARNMERIRVLLDAGANPAATDSSGATPLHHPWWSDRDQIGVLAGRGVDVNARDHAGRTPLHLAAARMNEIRITALLELGAYATARDTLSATPLHYLARESGPETGTSAADILLRAGADPNARDHSGKTPLAYIEHRSPLWWRLNDLRGENHRVRGGVQRDLRAASRSTRLPRTTSRRTTLFHEPSVSTGRTMLVHRSQGRAKRTAAMTIPPAP